GGGDSVRCVYETGPWIVESARFGAAQYVLKTFFRYGQGLLNFHDGVVAVMSDEERHMSNIPADLRYAASHEWACLLYT
ncbi:hypothetical protein ACQ4LH_21425, partial [Pseudomonas peli]